MWALWRIHRCRLQTLNTCLEFACSPLQPVPLIAYGAEVRLELVNLDLLVADGALQEAVLLLQLANGVLIDRHIWQVGRAAVHGDADVLHVTTDLKILWMIIHLYTRVL